MTATALVVDALSVRAPDAQATLLVNDVSLTLAPGRSLTLLGESGSGKSLLLQAVMGTLPAGLAAIGHVGLGEQITPAARPEARRTWWGRRLALLPQEPWSALDPTMRVLPQVSESYRHVRGLSKRMAAEAAANGLAGLGLAGDVGCKFPHQLSGGMAQRVAFAATMAGGAPVLLVDEPTKGLDSAMRAAVVALLKSIIAEGGAVLAITHDIAVARMLDDEVAVMLDARIVERGRASSVLTQPAHPYTRALLAAEPSAWLPRSRVRVDSGRWLVQASGLRKSFGGRELLNGMDLAIEEGERVAILGESGAGKSTLGNIVLGLLPADAGRIDRGAQVTPLGFQKLYQDPLASFAPRVTLRRSLMDVIERHARQWPQVDELLAPLKLTASLLDRLPYQVSGGELQRVALLRVLLLSPQLVFADEPTSRLDPVTQREVFDLLLDMLEAKGCAMLLVTHEQDLAQRVTDRVVRLGRQRETTA